jgi:hypothetical protein
MRLDQLNLSTPMLLCVGSQFPTVFTPDRRVLLNFLGLELRTANSLEPQET